MSTSAATIDAPKQAKARDFSKRYKKVRPGNAAEAQIVEEYLPLVKTVVGRLAMSLPPHVDIEDLYSSGLVGLLNAVRNFDPKGGSSFESYARVCVRGAMLDELRRMDWVPRTVHEKARRLQEVISILEQRFGRTPTEEQVARELNITVTEYGELLDEIRPAAFVCLDATCSSDGSDGGNLYEIVADPSDSNPVEEVSRRELKRVILDRLKQLPEMQRKVLALYYGEDLHLREIAEAFGLTESRICQIHAQAILGIRSYLQRYESGIAGMTASIKRA